MFYSLKYLPFLAVLVYGFDSSTPDLEDELMKARSNVSSALSLGFQPQHVHLAYGANSTEVTVTWSTKTSTGDSLVEWGTDVFSLSTTTKGTSEKLVDEGSEHSTQWIHRVHLYGLLPNTTYFYHVGSEVGWSTVFGFKTIPAGTTGWPLRLAVFGDMGAINAKSLTRLQQESHQGLYDAILHVGDLAYNLDSDNGRIGDTFMDQIEPIAAYLPYMTCPGNHENYYDFLHYRKRFSMPNHHQTENLYYSFDLGPVHFVSITTEVYYFGPDQPKRINQQYEWLISDLEEANTPLNRANRPWIVLFGHRPMYCSDRDGDDCTKINTRTRVGMPGAKRYGALEPLLAAYGVDLAIWAHEHSYERLYPIYNFTLYKGSEQEPYKNPRAPVHIITGSAGCQEGIDGFITPQPAWSACRASQYGYTKMTVLNKTHIDIRQIEDQKGAVIDSITLIKEMHGTYEHLI